MKHRTLSLYDYHVWGNSKKTGSAIYGKQYTLYK